MITFNTRSPLAQRLSIASDEFLVAVIANKNRWNPTARRLAKLYQNQRAGKHAPASPAQLRARMMGQVKFFATGAVGSINSLRRQLHSIDDTDANIPDAASLLTCIDLSLSFLKDAIRLSEDINRKAMLLRSIEGMPQIVRYEEQSEWEQND